MTPHNPDVEFNLQWIPDGKRPGAGRRQRAGARRLRGAVHVDREGFDTSADVEKWAAGIPVPTYAIDDQTAVKVTDGKRRSCLRGELEAVHAVEPVTMRR